MRVLAFVLCALGAFPLYAMSNVNVYQTQVAVSDEQSSSAHQARKQGMEQVLIKASGDPKIASNSVIAKALNDSARYLSQFGYQSDDASQVMSMSFNGEQIRQLLTQAQVPIWPVKRENILLWWVDNTEYERTVLWETSESQPLQDFRQSADQMGLPVSIPVGDFDDVTGVSAADLWGGFVQSIAKASARYPVDAVLIVKAQGEQLRWQLYDAKPNAIANTEVSLNGQASGSGAAKDIVARLSRYYAQKNGLTLTTTSDLSVDIQVSGIKNASDFFHLERGLITLNAVASAQVTTLRGDSAAFRLDLLTSQTGFLSEATTKLSLTESRLSDLTSSQELLSAESYQNANRLETDASSVAEVEHSQDVTAPAIDNQAQTRAEPSQGNTQKMAPVVNAPQQATFDKPDYRFIWQE
ncbi:MULTISPECIES: DUF2066 domain-containing protein [unclassified Vibrio]|uniref:DUF2066 domain-containing protein n=1 Tax=Vibrio sp. HB236076 TaxID=3232307 RepID=A0AB39HIG4_9VIBR|nr:DUF2066 domain-containing protein [Vibrio sp. HB161653]MDP5254825.1 DUF2066 domain-containing protein [Vibrio sp. HB161653]